MSQHLNEVRENSQSTAPAASQTDAPQTRREHFIPIRKIDLDELLPDYRDLNESDRQKFHEVCLLLDALIHYRYHNQLSRALQIYAHLDPDSVLMQSSVISDLLRDSLTDQFFAELRGLLKQANYVRLEREEIQNAVDAASQLGVRLRVDLDVFSRLEVYARGNDVETWSRRSWLKMFRKVEFDVAVFRRLIIVFRLRDHDRLRTCKHETADHVYLKTFKNIPHSDLDALLPGSTIKMSLMDRSRIILPSISGVAINVFKAWRTFMLFTVFASMYTLFSWIGLLIAVVAYLAKFFFGYMRTHDKYRLNLTQHLYFQNLDNNKGGLYRILNEAEEQDFREAAIAYFVLWQDSASCMTSAALDQKCEQMLNDITGEEVDFEVDDALRKLVELQIASADANDQWSVLQPDETLAKLDQTWDEIFPYFKFASKI